MFHLYTIKVVAYWNVNTYNLCIPANATKIKVVAYWNVNLELHKNKFRGIN